MNRIDTLVLTIKSMSCISTKTTGYPWSLAHTFEFRQSPGQSISKAAKHFQSCTALVCLELPVLRPPERYRYLRLPKSQLSSPFSPKSLSPPSLHGRSGVMAAVVADSEMEQLSNYLKHQRLVADVRFPTTHYDVRTA